MKKKSIDNIFLEITVIAYGTLVASIFIYEVTKFILL